MPQSHLSRTGALLLLILAPASAHADPILASGTGIEIAYGSDGLAFDSDLEAGIQGYLGSTPAWYDFTYYQSGSTTIDPFLASAFSYERDGDLYEFAGYVQGTSASATSVDWTTTSSADISGDGLIGVEYVWEMGDLQVTKTETWEEDGFAVFVHFTVTNLSDEPLESFNYMHLIDPADTTDSLNSTNTRNDLQDNDGDGVQEYAQAQGRSTTSRTNNRTLGIGLCDPGSEEVNFKSGVEVLVSEALDAGFDGDNDGATSDQQIIYLHSEDTIAEGASVAFGFIIAVGTNDGDALDAFNAAQPGCWDLDGDGHASEEFGGDDCDDSDDSVYAGADEVWYDGYDQDCGDDDDYDQDVDGYADAEYADEYGPTLDPGTGEPIDGTGELDPTDCDDTSADVNEGVEETWYNGLDEDCGGDNDFDQDGDGYVADEYEGDDTLSPGSGEVVDDGSGVEPGDCDDLDEDVHADADEIWYDGYDQDCGEDDDYDQDADGYADAGHADDYGPTRNTGTGEAIDGTGELDPTDCDDENPDANEGVEETWYNGLDDDCGGGDDYDQDGDGYADAGHADEYGPTYTTSARDEEVSGTGELEPTDCDDTAVGTNPEVEDTWYDGVDADCGGDDDYDQDADGHADLGHADDYGPTYTDADLDNEVPGTGALTPDDCDDLDPSVTYCDQAKIYRGGGGCTCSAGPADPGSLGGAALLGVALGLWSRRRRAGPDQRA